MFCHCQGHIKWINMRNSYQIYSRRVSFTTTKFPKYLNSDFPILPSASMLLDSSNSVVYIRDTRARANCCCKIKNDPSSDKLLKWIKAASLATLQTSLNMISGDLVVSCSHLPPPSTVLPKGDTEITRYSIVADWLQCEWFGWTKKGGGQLRKWHHLKISKACCKETANDPQSSEIVTSF